MTHCRDCGKAIPPAQPFVSKHIFGLTFYFCSKACWERFRARELHR